VAGSCECGNESSGSSTMELVNGHIYHRVSPFEAPVLTPLSNKLS
jgi:hypothetical protein